MNFRQLALREEIQGAIETIGYEKPSEIQGKTIPLLLEGKDIIGQSQTGTGKTAAFMLWILEKVMESDSSLPKALIMCPTRELAMQVANEGRKFAQNLKGINIVSVYGGEAIDKQIRELKNGKDIIVGTPGRIMDHIRRRTLRLNECGLLVLDEADEMLNMGFHDDIVEIISHLPEQRQTALFSATMPKPILNLTKTIQKDPELVKIKKDSLTVSAIKQVCYEVFQSDKLRLLVQLLQIYKPKSAMVFCNTKKQVDDLVNELNSVNVAAMGLHGDMRQEMRTSIMKRFKEKKTTILVATDVAARGIDVDNIDIVFNFDIPQELEYYVHRIGRTGRAGKKGVAVTFYNPKQHRALKDIERIAKCVIEKQPLPTKDDLHSLVYDQLLATIMQWKYVSTNTNEVLESLYEAGYTDIDVTKALVNKFIAENSYKALDAPLKTTAKEKKKNVEKFVKVVVGIGKKHDVNAAHLISAIAQCSSVSGKEIGKIKIEERTSIVEIPASKEREVIASLSKTKVRGKDVFVTATKR